jgi:hypothetical protein
MAAASPSTAVLGQLATVPIVAISTTAIAVSTAVAGTSEATTVDFHHRLSML